MVRSSAIRATGSGAWVARVPAAIAVAAKMEEDGTMEVLKKKERLMKSREREKLEKTLSGIKDMSRVPGALFIVDINREHIAVKEAQRLEHLSGVRQTTRVDEVFDL